MVRGCSAAVGNFTEVIHNRVGGEERRARLELVPLHSIRLYKNNERRNEM